MKKPFVAAALAAALAQPAGAATFPTLTTIYVGTGVRDDGGGSDAGTATSFHCSNVSGISATVRFLVLNTAGSVVATDTITVAHGDTTTVSTHSTESYVEDLSLGSGAIGQGVVNIESTQSGVFCSAMTIDAATNSPIGVTLPLVRVNPHPGTVE